MGDLVSPLRYDCQHDVEMRLHGSIVRYKGEPVNVRILSEESDPFDGLGVQLKPITSNKWDKKVHSSDEDLDISSVPLGYINMPTFTGYATRIPYRKQKQGISGENTVWWPEYVGHLGVSVWSALCSKNFYNTVFNIYPNADAALKLFSKKNDIYSIAIHRKFALVRDELNLIKLKHMTKPIGWIPPGERKCYLTEENYNPIFEEELNNIGLECRVG